MGLIHCDISISNLLIQHQPSVAEIRQALKRDKAWMDQGLLSLGSYIFTHMKNLKLTLHTDKIKEFYALEAVVAARKMKDDDRAMSTAERMKRLAEGTLTFAEAIRSGLLNDLDYAGYTFIFTSTKEFMEDLGLLDSDVYNARTVCTNFFMFPSLISMVAGNSTFHGHTSPERSCRTNS